MLDNNSHAGGPPASRGPRWTATAVAFLTLAIFFAGLLLGMLTDAVESAGIEGIGWSLRGNGALIVPACGLPILLIASWAILARWLHADRLSCLGGVGVGILTLFLWLAALNVSQLLWLVLLLIALLVTFLLVRGSERQRTLGWLMASALVLPVAAYAGVLLGATVLPAR